MPPTASRPSPTTTPRRWYDDIGDNPLAWAIEADGRCIGAALLHHLDEENRRARYAIGIFNVAYWDRGVGTEATKLVMEYAFDALKLHRIDLRVLDYNLRAIRCYEKCGFEREGIEREAAFVDGAWHNDVIMSILEQDYRLQLAAQVANQPANKHARGPEQAAGKQ